MKPILLAIPIGIVGGLVAAAVMEGFQTIAAKPLGVKSEGDSSTVKAADGVSEATTGATVAKPYRMLAGRGVHYATGAALGAGYAVLVSNWPAAATGYGSVFGSAVALALDDVVVPALGLGASPVDTPLNVHGYGMAAHIVFGVVLEGVRQAGVALTD